MQLPRRAPQQRRRIDFQSTLEECFHCGAALPHGGDLTVDVRGEPRPVCSTGCRAVAALLEEHGLARFYDLRTAPSRKPSLQRGPWTVCDRPDVANRIARDAGTGLKELVCRIDGVTCAACVWLLKQGLRVIADVADVAVNRMANEAVIRFHPERARISDVLGAIERLGFRPRVPIVDAQDARVGGIRALLGAVRRGRLAATLGRRMRARRRVYIRTLENSLTFYLRDFLSRLLGRHAQSADPRALRGRTGRAR